MHQGGKLNFSSLFPYLDKTLLREYYQDKAEVVWKYIVSNPICEQAIFDKCLTNPPDVNYSIWDLMQSTYCNPPSFIIERIELVMKNYVYQYFSLRVSVKRSIMEKFPTWTGEGREHLSDLEYHKAFLMHVKEIDEIEKWKELVQHEYQKEVDSSKIS